MSILARCTAVTFYCNAHSKHKAERYHKDSNNDWLSTQNRAQKRSCKRMGIADEPEQLKSVDGIIKCRFHLIKSFQEVIHGHFDDARHFPELFTKK
jgi:ribosomal protein L44E